MVRCTDGLLFVAGHRVLLRSLDGGVTFQLPRDLPSLDIHAFAQAPEHPETVYAFVVGHGVYISTDAGDTWEPRVRAGQGVGVDTLAMLVDPADTATVLAGAWQSGLNLFTEGGDTFEWVLDAGVLSLAGDPEDDGRMITLTARGIEESSDAGRSWQVVVQPDVDGRPVAAEAGAGGRLWLVPEEPRALYHSTDGE